MNAQRASRRTSQRSNVTVSAPRALPARSSLGQHLEALRTRPGDLNVEDLRNIGRQIELCLRSGGKEVATAKAYAGEDADDNDDGDGRSCIAGLPRKDCELRQLVRRGVSLRAERRQSTRKLLLCAQETRRHTGREGVSGCTRLHLKTNGNVRLQGGVMRCAPSSPVSRRKLHRNTRARGSGLVYYNVQRQASNAKVGVSLCSLVPCEVAANAQQVNRSEKDQEVLLSTQDKVLLGLRALSSSLTPDLHRHFQTALLALVAQSGFTKKRGGYRQHLVQALVETVSGPVPPSALLPILRAKETGPSATDLAMEVLETVAGREHDDDSGSGGAKLKRAVLELLHHVVAEVVTSGVATRGKRATKGPPAHLMGMLVQSCSALPEYMLVFSKDILFLVDSRSSATRKLSLAVLRTILTHGRGQHRGAQIPALAAVLRLSRLDGDASVRSSAFDIVAEYLDQDGGYFNELDDDSASDPGNNTLSDHERRQVGTWETLPINENVSKMAEMEVVPCPGADTRSGDESDVAAPRTLPAPEVEAGDVASRNHAGKRGAFDLWAVGGVVLSSLSASADALLTDGSKTVRAKALACSLCILTAHGGGIKPACFDDGATEAGGAPRGSNTLKTILQAVAKGAWCALEAVATDSSGTMQAYLGPTGGGRSRRAADAARDLLLLPCVDVSPVDIIGCYARCRDGAGAGQGEAVATAEAKRALREVARVRVCADITSLLRAVSVVMAADHKEEDGGDPAEPFGDETDGGALPEGCTSNSLSEVLCELLSGMDSEVIVSLLRDAVEKYTRGEETGWRDGSGAKAPVLLRTLSLLGEASGASVTQGKRQTVVGRWGGNPGYDAAYFLAESQHLFWRRLEHLMEEVDHHESGEGGRRQCDSADESESFVGRSFGVGGRVIGGGGAKINEACGGFDVLKTRAEKATADSELPELLGIFRLLASRSLLPHDNGVALEALVFPTALSKRRLIRPAIGLALALEQPRQVLLSSLAILQDAAFARSSTDVDRACDYVRLIGVLARENSSFIAAYVREQHGVVEDESGQDLPRDERKESDGGGDYMAAVWTRQAMETEIRRLREASVTSDGMLSCYTPFLLAIVQRRVADSAANAPQAVEQTAAPLPSGDIDGGNDDAVSPEDESVRRTVEKGGEQKDDGDSAGSSCPSTLCVEALWALSEYAVLSPGLASAEVLPLAASLVGDSTECPQIRAAALCALTRRELATDDIAAHACGLLGDENPRLRQKVLRRLGSLMKESRIKTAHLSRIALLLVDADERVRQTAQRLFVDHLQPRPDSVCRCLFETYFTLDAAEAVKRQVLESLIVVSQRAAPGQGLGSLGGALMRKTAETGDADAAFFLSFVPPTIESFEVAEVALRRGQLAQAPLETISLAASHFAKRAHRRGSAAAAVGQVNGRGQVGGRIGGANLLPNAQALAMAKQIGSLSARRKVGRLSRGTVETSRENSGATQSGSTDNYMQRRRKGEKDDTDVCTPPAPSRRKRAQRRGSHNPTKEKGGRRLKKRGRPRETSSHRGGDSDSRCVKDNRNDDKDKARDSVEVFNAEREDEDEEMEWEG